MQERKFRVIAGRPVSDRDVFGPDRRTAGDHIGLLYGGNAARAFSDVAYAVIVVLIVGAVYVGAAVVLGLLGAL